MRLMEPLVRRETHVAIDAKDAVPGIADQRQSGFAQCRADRVDQLAERSQHFGLVDRLARLEPCRVVVVAQFAEKRERGRPEPSKPGRSLQRPAPSSMPRYVHRGCRFAGAAARLTAQFADEVGITLRTAPRLGEDYVRRHRAALRGGFRSLDRAAITGVARTDDREIEAA